MLNLPAGGDQELTLGVDSKLRDSRTGGVPIVIRDGMGLPPTPVAGRERRALHGSRCQDERVCEVVRTIEDRLSIEPAGAEEADASGIGAAASQ